MTVFVPIASKTHANKVWKKVTNFAFAAEDILIPLVAAEINKVAATMPVAFVKGEVGFQLAAVASLDGLKSQYVAPDGRWLGSYIPAALRAYPFRILKPENSDQPVLCINEASGLVGENTEEGSPFFDDENQPTQEMIDKFEFLSKVDMHLTLTEGLVKTLGDVGLLTPWELSLEQGEEVATVRGLFRVDQEAFDKLNDEDFLTLRKSGGLAIPYGQIYSMDQLAILKRLHQHHADSAAGNLESFSLAEDEGSLVFD